MAPAAQPFDCVGSTATVVTAAVAADFAGDWPWAAVDLISAGAFPLRIGMRSGSGGNADTEGDRE